MDEGEEKKITFAGGALLSLIRIRSPRPVEQYWRHGISAGHTIHTLHYSTNVEGCQEQFMDKTDIFMDKTDVNGQNSTIYGQNGYE